MKKRTYTDAKQVAKLRYLGKPSIRPAEWDAEKRDISRDAVYNHLPAVPIDTRAKPTTETRRQSDYERTRQLRPVYYAIFTDRWEWHGRLYTGKYGHQSLRKVERRTLRFDGEQSVELDYAGMHPRLLYHLEGIPFDADPYALWGAETTRPMRLMAKQLINAAINAETGRAAIDACNQAMNTKTANGERKTGAALADAQQLYRASKETRLKFKNAHQSALRYARLAGKYLIRAKEKLAHGSWTAWVERNFGNHRTANGYMSIAEGWEEIEHDPNLSIREALKALTTRKRSAKKFNPDDLIWARIFKQINQRLRIAWKDWTPEDNEDFELTLGWHPDLDDLVVEGLNKLGKEIRRQLGKKLTKEEIRKELERARDRLRLKLDTQRAVLKEYEPNWKITDELCPQDYH